MVKAKTKIGDMTMNLSTLIKSVEVIAKDAAKLMLGCKPTKAMVTKKGRIDLVTEVDIAVNDILCKALAQLDITIDLIAEEGVADALKHPSARYAWVIDPIDGTTNFVHGLDHSAVSIALYDREAEESLLALIHNPFRDECFTAIKNGGAFLNGAPIHVSDVTTLDDAVIATGFAYDRKINPDNSMAEFTALMREVQGVRRFGAASLDLAYVASGRLDGYFERGLKFWDYAAGMLLVHEAGGKATAYDGGPVTEQSGHILSSNSNLYAQLLSEIQNARRAIGLSVLPGCDLSR